MGVPKFFRYISERYPCLSEVVREYQIPEFDNLYLDMNGIIHQCSHPDDDNVHFRMSEEKMFKDIFHYIEVLFRMIKPQKVFFMAIDGVAPRAKMNQQRGRRFRSAKDVEKKRAQAEKKGEVLPEEEPFDSNCITPGTVFMARLHEQLKYFVVDKISNDPMWQKCQVILSGHETPGEGEHKIMDYIRYIRSQPNYNPNTRHCLYGLDADLIMLGMCTHEPHFSLLREEVKFGRKSTKKITVPEEIKFYLLHLSLMRDYLDLEFQELKTTLTNFSYNLENIIDDWVLMSFLVGNDFIPNLPNMHITNGALPILYKAYMEVLPTLDGYINEGGKLNLERFEKLMHKLSSIDMENFEDIRDDLLYMERKTGRKAEAHTKVSCKPHGDEDENGFNENTTENSGIVRDSGLAALIQEAYDLCSDPEDGDYSPEDEDELAFKNYKKEYYQNKLEYENVTQEVLKDQAEGYVRAIQWNLHYYYNGCCSWSWYYPHHYAPYISDIKDFQDLKITFDIGKPFLPFQQLLSVLPPLSKKLLPECYHGLMLDQNSSISKYFPEDFQTDLNGKRQEWEAVVLVPFIDENILLEAMETCNDKLSEEESRRNTHGPMLIYKYTKEDKGLYSAPDYFPSVENHTEVKTLTYLDILVPPEKLIKGVHPRAKKDVYFPGFPTMRHLKYKGELKKEKIKVFESPSRNENMIITIIPNPQFTKDLIPVDLLGTRVFVGWPHLIEAKVAAISNSNRKYICMGGPNQYNVKDRSEQMVKQFEKEVDSVVERYEKRMGIKVGEVKVLVHVHELIGYRYSFSPQGKLILDKQFSPEVTNYPVQAVVFDIMSYEGDRDREKDPNKIFSENSICFVLTNPYYGSQGTVLENLIGKNGRVKISAVRLEEPDFLPIEELRQKIRSSYKTLYNAASQLGISNHLFSRVTGSIFITVFNTDGSTKNVNVGLDLKFNKRNAETPGYTKKFGNTWCYTEKAVELVREYCEKFPQVFEHISTDHSMDDIFVTQIFGEDWEKPMEELQKWLKSLPTYGLERQTCGFFNLESEVVEEVEKIVSNFVSDAKKVVMQVKPNLLYIPELQIGTMAPDPKTECVILDRIVNIRTGFTVPFGHKGTIIAIHESSEGSQRDTMYDVMFDRPFKNGMLMSCSEPRCYRLPKSAFINITYGKRLFEGRAGKTGELINQAENSNQLPQQASQRPSYVPSQQNHQGFNQMNNSAFAQFTQYYNQCHSGNYNNGNNSNDNYQTRQSFDQHYKKPSQERNNTDVYSPKTLSKPKEPPTPVAQVAKKDFLPSFAVKVDIEKGGRTVTEVQKSVIHPQPLLEQQNSFSKKKTENERTSVDDDQLVQKEKRNSQSKPNAVVNTEFLKNILGIKSETTPTKNKPVDPQTPPAQTQSNVSFEQFAQVANAPANVRLMTYYQSNGLGLPRYQYFPVGKNVQAQIKLHDGKLICGKPGVDREEATENLAIQVLELLMKKKQRQPEENKESIPVPPQAWIDSENKPVTNSEVHEKSRKFKHDASVTKAFVPLQVVKNQISKSASKTEPDNKQEKHVPDNGQNDPSKEETVPKHNKRQRKPRQTRIAAKFEKKE